MIRSAHTVLADFEAFERFKKMNSSARSTTWSRDREDELGAMLRHELGLDAVAQLRAWALISPDRLPEDRCIELINHALKRMGDRDLPRTLPANGLLF